MRLQISNSNLGDVGVRETADGTYVNLQSTKEPYGLSLLEVQPFFGVSLKITEQPTNGHRLFLPCKFNNLYLEGDGNTVRLSGVNYDTYTIRVQGCNNCVMFTDDANVKCVNWEELGNWNTLDVSQQENTATSGTFGPTTSLITKIPNLPSCSICCGEDRANVLMVPCGHLGACRNCVEEISKRSKDNVVLCPFCKQLSTPMLIYIP